MGGICEEWWKGIGKGEEWWIKAYEGENFIVERELRCQSAFCWFDQVTDLRWKLYKDANTIMYYWMIAIHHSMVFQIRHRNESISKVFYVIYVYEVLGNLLWDKAFKELRKYCIWQSGSGEWNFIHQHNYDPELNMHMCMCTYVSVRKEVK